MAQPTSISVSTDDVEYSRYEANKDTVNATIHVSGGAPYSAEEIYVELVKARRARDAVVAVSALSISGATDPQLSSVSFHLPDLVDQDMINLVRHGKYFVRATSPASGASAVVGTVTGTPITIHSVEPGSAYNSYTVEVVVPSGNSELFVTVIGSSVTISLATSGGVPVASKNTREAVRAFIASNLASVLTASFGGPAGLSLSQAEGPVPFSGGRDAVVAESDDFDIRIVTVERLKRDYLFGIPLIAGEVRHVRFQPSNITGVTITELSKGHALGVYPLTYNYVEEGGVVSRTLSWNGGPVVPINQAGTYILRRGGSAPTGIRSIISAALATDYIIVRVAGPSFLPTSHQVDELLVENMKIDDEALARYLDQSIDWVENTALAIHLEPTNIVTDRDPTMIQYAAGINSPSPIFTDPDYDFIVGPLTYFVPRAGGDWVDIQTPYPQILRIDSLFGSIANTRVIDIDLDWIQAYPQGGLIQIVPFNQSIAFDYLGLIWVNALRGAQAIPNFWHFNMIVGLRDTPGELQELIAKKAAMDALVTLGMALRPGVGSVSLGRDGVSQSVSYTTQAQYGPYTGAINAFKEWIDTNLVKLKGKYRGATMIVV